MFMGLKGAIEGTSVLSQDKLHGGHLGAWDLKGYKVHTEKYIQKTYFRPGPPEIRE